MTIFILDSDLRISASFLDDKSLNSCIKTITLALCSVHYIEYEQIELGIISGELKKIPLPYKKYKSFEPIAQWRDWCCTCRANYLWLVDYGRLLANEYFYRAGFSSDNYNLALHEISQTLDWLLFNVPDFYENNLNYKEHRLPFILVIPKKYQTGSLICKDENLIIKSYCTYYRGKLEPRILKYKEWVSDVSGIGVSGCGVVHTQTFSEANWTKRQAPEWIKP